MIQVVNKKTHKITVQDYYVGRGSVLGNVYDFVGSNHPQVKFHVNTRDEAIAGYRKYLTEALESGNPEICREINRLIVQHKAGQDINLICFCWPKLCHGNIIKEIVESATFLFKPSNQKL